jgi:hypothetical protein
MLWNDEGIEPINFYCNLIYNSNKLLFQCGHSNFLSLTAQFSHIIPILIQFLWQRGDAIESYASCFVERS